MAKLMLVNPRRRARKASAPKRRKASAARRANPITVKAVKRTYRRRANPIKARRVIRRRRNPISLKSFTSGGISTMLKNAVVGGAGAVAMDLVMGQVNRYLPASLQSTGGVDLNAAVRAALTVVLGNGLSKMTRGMSKQAAVGALTVQAADLLRPMVARNLPAAVSGVGYSVPNATIPRTARIGPVVRGMSAFTRAGSPSPLLSAYTAPGSPSPLLSSARSRESVRR